MRHLLILCYSVLSILSLSAQNAFVTTWTVTGKEVITIPHNPDASLIYDYQVDWGDGSPIQSFVTRNGGASHTYNSLGTFTVEITGTYPAIYLNNTSSASKLTTIEQWGGIDWQTMHREVDGHELIIGASPIGN